MKDFSAFLDMKRYKNWAHKISSWKYPIIWRPVLPVFPRHRVPHFCSPPWTPFRGIWKSAAAAAPDLILVDGKCPWQVPICSWHFESQNLLTLTSVPFISMKSEPLLRKKHFPLTLRIFNYCNNFLLGQKLTFYHEGLHNFSSLNGCMVTFV